jgi:putative ABC transport system substrate-binding protein
MRRRGVIAGLGGALLAWPRVVRAQQRGRVHRIGVLDRLSPRLNSANIDAFTEGLRHLGYVEKQNLAIEYRSADGNNARFPALAAELVALPVDVIVARGTPAVLAARNATNTIPIVMAASGEPIGVGVVESLARPGGNVTGLSAFAAELAGKRIELLREMIPNMVRISALLNMGNPVFAFEWTNMQTAAEALRLQRQLLDVRSREDIATAFDTARAWQSHGLIVGTDTLTQANREMIAELAATHRLPAMYTAREFAEAGGLIVYGVIYPDLYRRAAEYVDRILRGAKPAELPVQQPTKFELVVNLKAAKAIGLEPPPALLARADEVIE